EGTVAAAVAAPVQVDLLIAEEAPAVNDIQPDHKKHYDADSTNDGYVYPAVMPYHPVTVEFTRPVDAGSFNAANVTVRVNDGNTGWPGRYSLSSGGMMGTYIPENPYPVGAKVDVTVMSGIKDPYGRNLAGTQTARFFLAKAPEQKVDRDKIKFLYPEDGETCTVKGETGAITGGKSLVLYNPENNQTVSPMLSGDGSFNGSIEAKVGDRVELWITFPDDGELKITDALFVNEAGTEVIIEDGETEYISPTNGIGVSFKAGSFGEPVVVSLTPEPGEAELLNTFPQDLQLLGMARVTYGGLRSREPVALSIPAPSGVSATDDIYLARKVDYLGDTMWMLTGKVKPVVSEDGSIERLESGPLLPEAGEPEPCCFTGGRKQGGVFSFVRNTSGSPVEWFNGRSVPHAVARTSNMASESCGDGEFFLPSLS
ncbi:MAG: Ig-like domain-containing protein, partial [Herbaspirillum sp.]|uniref:Ig-like domain-containing protein n=1 Tax=Herbaspirillum sp. TaxID=1890675 RepID=UPI00258DF9B7